MFQAERMANFMSNDIGDNLSTLGKINQVITNVNHRSGKVNKRNAISKVLTEIVEAWGDFDKIDCLLYTSPSPRDRTRSRMPSSA